MIEKILRDYLNRNASVPCYLQRPKVEPDKYILIEKTGSFRRNYIIRSTFAIQSYAPRLYQAAELNEEVKTLLDNAVVMDEISASKLNSDYNFTNTADKHYRYQAVYNITHF